MRGSAEDEEREVPSDVWMHRRTIQRAKTEEQAGRACLYTGGRWSAAGRARAACPARTAHDCRWCMLYGQCTAPATHARKSICSRLSTPSTRATLSRSSTMRECTCADRLLYTSHALHARNGDCNGKSRRGQSAAAMGGAAANRWWWCVCGCVGGWGGGGGRAQMPPACLPAYKPFHSLC